jgi:hypothetical protein
VCVYSLYACVRPHTRMLQMFLYVCEREREFVCVSVYLYSWQYVSMSV